MFLFKTNVKHLLVVLARGVVFFVHSVTFAWWSHLNQWLNWFSWTFENVTSKIDIFPPAVKPLLFKIFSLLLLSSSSLSLFCLFSTISSFLFIRWFESWPSRTQNNRLWGLSFSQMSAKFGRLLFKNLANFFSPSKTTLTAGDLSFVVCLQEAFPKNREAIEYPRFLYQHHRSYHPNTAGRKWHYGRSSQTDNYFRNLS